MWDIKTLQEQLDFLCKLSGISSDEIDHRLIHECEERLNHEQRTAYVDYISGIAADLTYRRMHPDSPDASTLFYFTMMRIPRNIRAKMIWCAVTGNQP